MKIKGVDQIIETDVLVIGGGLSGIWAAIRARDFSVSVALVEKGTMGKSGCSVFAAGDISVLMPGDDLEAFIEKAARIGEYLNDQKLLEIVWRESYDRVMDMDRWGVTFKKDSMKHFVRKSGRGDMVPSVLFPAGQMMWTLRKIALSKDVNLVNKVAIVELLSKGGKVTGALGVNVQTGASYLFKAKAVVSATGPCSFKATYIGHRTATGEGQAMAHRIGAASINMEFGTNHNTGHVDYDVAGMARFVAMGGKFVNAKSENFMSEYDPVLKDMAVTNTLIIAMAKEVRAGRGPIYFDMTSINDADYQLSRELLPQVFRVFDRTGIDIRKEKMRWCPQLSGTRAGPAGLKVDYDLNTTVPGLFAAGDVAAKTHLGCVGSIMGTALTWCMVSGYRAGQSAAKYAEGAEVQTLDRARVTDLVNSIFAPLKRDKGPVADDIVFEIQRTIIPYDVLILRHGNRLRKALENIKKIKEDRLPLIRATDSHELVKAHEARSMVCIAEMVLLSSIMRTESRGLLWRDDHPQRDDKNWLKWICLKRQNGNIEFWTEPVPIEEYSYKPKKEGFDAH